MASSVSPATETTIRARLVTRDFVTALLVTLSYFTTVGILQPEIPRHVVGPLQGNGVAIGGAGRRSSSRRAPSVRSESAR
jgi:hypothetical protein